MSDAPHTVEVVVEHEAEAPPPEPKGEAAPAPPAKGKGHVGDLSELAKATKAKFTESQAAKKLREEAEKAAPKVDAHEATDLERTKVDLEAAQREVATLRAEVAAAHQNPLAFLVRCGVSPDRILGQLSRLDLNGELRQHVTALEQRHAQEHGGLRARGEKAQQDLDRIASEHAVLDAFDAGRATRYSHLAGWIDRQAARERVSPSVLVIREFLEQVGRLGDATEVLDGRVGDEHILDQLDARYADVAPSTRSRRSETRRAADEDERPGKAAPPTLSNAQASEVTASLPDNFDSMDDRSANRALGAFAKSIGVFRNT